MKKGKFSKLVIASIFILNIAFTGAVLYIFLKTSAEPTTLIVSWFGFTTGELGLAAFIKKQKIKEGGNEDV
jgi:hypothetical protein